jgi:hypothetical protein
MALEAAIEGGDDAGARASLEALGRRSIRLGRLRIESEVAVTAIPPRTDQLVNKLVESLRPLAAGTEQAPVTPPPRVDK